MRDTNINMAVLSRFFVASLRPCKAFRLVEQCDQCSFDYEFSLHFYVCIVSAICIYSLVLMIFFFIKNIYID